MEALLVTVHILAAAVWIGAGIYGSFSYPRHVANRTLRSILAVDEKLGSIVFGTAIALVLLTGIVLVLMSDSIGFGHAFVLVGIGVVVVTSLVEVTVSAPAMKRAVEGEADGSSTVEPWLRWAPAVYILLFGFTVWAMVTRLGV
jgi:uncharacterized membrane protein